MDPLEDAFDVSGDSKHEQDEEEVDEEKKSIQQKIEQANRQLQDQEAPDKTRRRRLHFKDTLVDLVVPASDLEDSPADVSGHMLKLKISSQEESDGGDGHREGVREGRVLVEKDGKFDLVSLKEVESPGLLPPLPETQTEPGKSPSSSPKLFCSSGSSASSEPRYAPRPPARPWARPNSASNMQRVMFRHDSKRRVQSASGVSSHATFFLSLKQKELLNEQQQRREKLAREVGTKLHFTSCLTITRMCKTQLNKFQSSMHLYKMYYPGLFFLLRRKSGGVRRRSKSVRTMSWRSGRG